MNTAHFVRLIFLNDVRARWIPLLLLAALLALLALLPLHADGTGNWPVAAALQLVLLLGLGTFLLTIPTVTLDPTGREFRFLLTRPVPGGTIGLAKALFLTTFIVIPYYLSMEIVVARSGVPLSVTDHLLLLLETVVTAAGAVTWIALWCAFVSNRLLVVVIAVLLLIVPPVIREFWQAYSIHHEGLPRWWDAESDRLILFQTFLEGAVFLVIGLCAIGWRYRSKRFYGPLILALAGYGLSIAASFFPYNLAQGLQDQSSQQSLLTSEQLGRIRMNLITKKGFPHPYQLGGGGWNNIHIVTLNQYVRFEGLEMPYFAQTVDYHAVITLRSGKKITSNFEDFLGHGGGTGQLDASFLGLVAGVLPWWPYDKDQAFDLLTYLPNDLPHEDITGATVKGTITLQIYRAYVVGSMPMREGASFGARRRRYVVAHADFTGNRLAINLNGLQVPIALRGDLSETSGKTNELQWIPVYRPYGQELKQEQTSADGTGMRDGVAITHREYVFDSAMEGLYPPVIPSMLPGYRALPADWASGAELVFIATERCGQITRPYEINNVDLNYKF